MKQAANSEVCYNSELPVEESATTWEKKFKDSGKLSKCDCFSRQDIKFIYFFKTLIEFSPIFSQELYIGHAFWRCVEHLDTHFPFISPWSFKNSILWYAVQPIFLKWQGRAFSLQYLEKHLFHFFPVLSTALSKRWAVIDASSVSDTRKKIHCKNKHY